MMLSVFKSPLVFIFIFIFSLQTAVQANDDYREFTACVDELLDNNPGMIPLVAEDICADILDKNNKDLGSKDLCDLILRKKR